jgi:hypothetical protein
MGSSTSYAIHEVSCTVCGVGCNPLQERCSHCGHDPLQRAGTTVGPLPLHRFLRGVGVRLLLLSILMAVMLYREHFRAHAGLRLLDTVAVIAALLLLLSALHAAWQLGRLTQMRLLMCDSGLMLFYRWNGRLYLDWMEWRELNLPATPPRRGWLRLFYAMGHLVALWSFHWLTFLLPEPAKEMKLASLWNRARVWSIPLSPAVCNPTYTLTLLAAHALPYWLSQGLVQIEAGYEPSPDRPFLALDLERGTLRAYALREVLLDDALNKVPGKVGPYAGSEGLRPESINPDGTRVEPDRTLEPEWASAAPQEATPPSSFALPYGRYWLRADWELIRRIESLRRARETASSDAVNH